jgi:hypothetical protein
MVSPIIRGESYLGETGKSMKAGELAGPKEDDWRKIAIALIDPKALLHLGTLRNAFTANTSLV